MKLKTDTKVIVAGVALIVLGAWYLRRQVSGFALPSLGDFLPSADTLRNGFGDGIGAVGGYLGAAGVGAVEGIGLAVGVPRTDLSRCALAKAEGRWWDASFDCAAADYVSSGSSALWSGVYPSTSVRQSTQADVRRLDNAIDFSLPEAGSAKYDAMGNFTGYYN